MYEKEFKTAAGEKITVTTRLDSAGIERVMLCVAGKAGKYIVDLQSPLQEEEVVLLVGALTAANAHLRKVSHD